ncbi:MAG: helix-turn-helix domain-containing protein [Cellulomonas sp.]|nr:helix-turn-helix domain-containing protein [Cellulomonas sp.]
MTRTELAKLLRIDTRTVSRAIEDGDISAVRFGRQWFISRQAIIAMFGGGE